tara:strand:+ start:2589 stop:3335 length:747 start_codon:yes stop_codon:yes gene_type:complete
MRRNDPDDSRIYNYVYKITNLVNGRIYIGVHRTDDMFDGYMGSGTNMKRAINKHGVENFKKEIIQQYDVYKDALNHEADIVTEDFINRKDTYNIKIGGYGPCIFSEEHKQNISKSRRYKFKNDLEFADKMLKAAQCPERREKLGSSISKWIKDNPEKHMDRMMKINTNPEKIKKTADWHRGAKRSKKGCNNIKEGINAALKDPEVRKRRSGRGSKYYYDPETGVSKRYQQTDTIPPSWLPGTGPRKKK